jgi:hypothetical protein
VEHIKLSIRRGPSVYEWNYCDPFFVEQIRWKPTEVPRTTPPEEASCAIAQVYRKRFGHADDQPINWQWKRDIGRVAHAFEALLAASLILFWQLVGLILFLAVFGFAVLLVIKIVEWVLR